MLKYKASTKLPGASARKRNTVLCIVVFLGCLGLLYMPTGFERELHGVSVKVRVAEVDDSSVRRNGIVRTGQQGLIVEILEGAHSGALVPAVNHLVGKLELDKVFAPGDVALARMDGNADAVLDVTMQDHFRLNTELILLGLFALMLVGYAGLTGARALLSFLFAALAVWKLLLPGLLYGLNPILLSLGITAMLCFVVLFLVSGMDKKGLAAWLGSLAGLGVTAALALLFGHFFNIHGAVKPFSEMLLYSGFGHLDLTAIFLGGIFLASSGAVMDLAMDIAAAMDEIKRKNPDVTRWELIRSGNAIGRMVVGTMTTTLLLAYTGGFSTMLMVFIAQGMPVLDMLNLQYVAAEIMHTLAGSFGLVAVAPLTALLGGMLLCRAPHKAKTAATGTRRAASDTINAAASVMPGHAAVAPVFVAKSGAQLHPQQQCQSKPCQPRQPYDAGRFRGRVKTDFLWPGVLQELRKWPG